ncbi:rod shape-determining protein RodA [Lusitaniella coriacea LEGE 07157]|uniref:Peptidoglycan glycosyltransferase RodA n=1 Tax=Lusitaniella coriacea LEGE 07157 TaxID=945747 RepID=A0A8J7DYF7_9CYAN|nr:rod shape-determining protein RodA [Lusitaniella coriacea]MBE9117786.1 rod shape-determining protein RodA [Lusitaniella coriacea LEGE 07157]
MMQKSLTPFRWYSFFSAWQQIDFLLLILVVGLTALGGIAIRSTELNQGLTDWWQHAIIGGIGLVLVLWISRFRYDTLLQWHWVTYAITNVLLITVLLVGVTINGSKSWIYISRFSLQPSEFAKVGLIISLAALLHHRPASSLAVVFRAFAIAAVPLALISQQPDLGTSLVFGAITLGMLYWANANPGWLILLISPLIAAILYNIFFPSWLAWAVLMGILAWFTLPWRFLGTIGAVATNLLSGGLAGFAWGLLKPYQKDRLVLFLHPEKDPLGGGYHLIQSRIAIGAGEVWGRGLNQGTQTQLNFIPEQHNDFIFSAIGEELGFVGCLFVVIAFWLICFRLVRIALKANENFGSLLAIGTLSMIVFQAFINISMTIGLAPITGIPLPYLSYGGSALLTNFLAIALVESVANHRRKQTF